MPNEQTEQLSTAHAFEMTSLMDKNQTIRQQIINYLYVVFLAFMMATNYEIFIFPCNFAPAGINGIATMIQYKMNFSIGYMSLLINVPLCLMAFVLLNKDYSAKTLLFCVSFSLFVLLYKYVIDISDYTFSSDNTSSFALAAAISGVINGFIYGSLMKINASTGGTDVISASIRCVKPHLSLSWIIFGLNSVVAVASFFVYDCKYEPVILCLLYLFLTSKVSDSIVKGVREQIKFEIITDKCEEVSLDIIKQLRHTVTVIPAKGMYSGKETNLLICIINKHQIFELQKILKRYPGTFAYVSTVTETLGNFKKIKVQ